MKALIHCLLHLSSVFVAFQVPVVSRQENWYYVRPGDVPRFGGLSSYTISSQGH